MNTKQLVILLMATCLSLPAICRAGEVIKPLPIEEVKPIIATLNKQGIIFRGTNVPEGEEPITKDEVFEFEEWVERPGAFGMKDTGEGWYLYKVDINNDKEDEYAFAMFGGSGSFLSIESIYQLRDDKLINIYNQIEKPMDKLIREAEKAPPDSEVSYTTFMNGTLTIEKDDNKIYFTLSKLARTYANVNNFVGYFYPPRRFKFLWEGGRIRMIEYSVGDKVYKL